MAYLCGGDKESFCGLKKKNVLIIWKHALHKRSTNYGPGAESGSLPVFVNKVLLEQPGPFVHILFWLLSCYGGKAR